MLEIDFMFDHRAPKLESSEALTAPRTISCVHCGGSRPCGPGCSCPCHGFFAPKSCAETFKRQADKEREEFPPFPEAPDPETITECKPQQLRAGKFLTLCECTKRNGLQHLCRRWGCSEKCLRLRPKQRKFQLGDPVPVLDSTPKCCAGKMQVNAVWLKRLDFVATSSRRGGPTACWGWGKVVRRCSAPLHHIVALSKSWKEFRLSILSFAEIKRFFFVCNIVLYDHLKKVTS